MPALAKSARGLARADLKIGHYTNGAHIREEANVCCQRYCFARRRSMSRRPPMKPRVPKMSMR